VQSSSRFSNEHILLPVANIENAEKYLDLALLIKDKKSPNPISILSVVNNDHEAERNLIRAKINLQHFVDQGSASETQVNVITTIDHNAMSGISRTSQEKYCLISSS
jgi:hypothetical protein